MGGGGGGVGLEVGGGGGGRGAGVSVAFEICFSSSSECTTSKADHLIDPARSRKAAHDHQQLSAQSQSGPTVRGRKARLCHLPARPCAEPPPSVRLGCLRLLGQCRL